MKKRQSIKAKTVKNKASGAMFRGNRQGAHNSQAGKSISSQSRSKRSHSAQDIATNMQAGRDATNFKALKIDGNRNVQGVGNKVIAMNNRDGCVNFSNNNIKGNNNSQTVHNHYHNPAYDELLQRHLELIDRYLAVVDKYTLLLEERTKQPVLHELQYQNTAALPAMR